VYPTRDSRAQGALVAQPVAFVRDDDEEDEDQDDDQEDEPSYTMPSWSELFPSAPRPGERVSEAQFQSDSPTLGYASEQRLPSRTPLIVGKFDPKGKFRSFPPGQVGRYRVIKKNKEEDESQEDESQEDEQDQQDENGLDWNEWFPQVPIPQQGQGIVGGQTTGGQGGAFPGGRFRTGMMGGKRRRPYYVMRPGGSWPMAGRRVYSTRGRPTYAYAYAPRTYTRRVPTMPKRLRA